MVTITYDITFPTLSKSMSGAIELHDDIAARCTMFDFLAKTLTLGLAAHADQINEDDVPDDEKITGRIEFPFGGAHVTIDLNKTNQ